MRRVGAILVMAMLLALTVASPAAGKRPVPPPAPDFPVVSSVTITETGGTWPYCEQVATLDYTSGHQPGTVAIWPYLEGGSWLYSYRATVRNAGTVDIAISGTDYSQTSKAQPSGWFWVAQTGTVRTMPANRSITTSYRFRGGTCPAPGMVLASGTLALPSTWR